MTDSEGEGAGPSPARRTGAAAPPPHGIERRLARAALGLASDLPFRGEDLWTGYEFSWLNAKGKPQAAGLRLAVPCASPRLAESKSLKLYLNSFADRPFASRAEVLRALDADLESALGAPAGIELLDIERLNDAADRLPASAWTIWTSRSRKANATLACCSWRTRRGAFRRRSTPICSAACVP